MSETSESKNVTPEVSDGVSTPVVSEDVEMGSGATGVKIENKLSEQETLRLNLEREHKLLEEKAKSYLARQTKPVVIPSFAKWFNLDEIHEIEKRSLPEFFSGQSRYKTPKVYKEFRDFMVNCYRLNPIEYLTVTAMRRNLAGDVASIIRVHGFLEKWGLINYQVDPKTKTSLMGPQYTGHFQITLDTPSGLAPFVPEKVVLTNKEKEEVAKLESKDTLPFNMELEKNIYDSTKDAFVLRDEDFKKNPSGLVSKQFFCLVCGNDASTIRYHHLITKQNICSKCFKQGLFPSNFQSTEFIELASDKLNRETWSDQEVLLLLEGIEMYLENWIAIAGHVATKSKEECIKKFIQLPIEDRYISEQWNKLKTSTTNTNLTDSLVRKVLENLTSDSEAKISQTSAQNKDSVLSESTKILNEIVEYELQKIDLKLQKFEILDTTLQFEKKLLLKQKLEFYDDIKETKLAKQDEQSTEISQSSTAEEVPLEPISQLAPQNYKFWSA